MVFGFMHLSSAIPWGGGGGGWPVDLFYGYIQGDLIDNLPSKEVEMREVCFLMSYPRGGDRGLCSCCK